MNRLDGLGSHVKAERLVLCRSIGSFPVVIGRKEGHRICLVVDAIVDSVEVF